MKLRMVLLFGIIATGLSCTKDETPTPPPLPENHYGETFQIQFAIDSVPISKVYPADKINEKSVYIVDSANGSYFGGGPQYQLASGVSVISIQFATGFGNIKTNWDSAFASLAKLCAPGSKIYDSVNYMTQTHTNRVEITYVDASGAYSTTKTIDSIRQRPANLPIDQTGSNFVITSEKLVSTNNGKNNAVLIKGTFNCTIYKFNSYKARKITNGSFVAVFDVI